MDPVVSAVRTSETAPRAAPGPRPRGGARTSAVAAAGAALLFAVVWLLLHVGFWGHGQIKDLPLYEYYGNAMADGKVPYRDFQLEYPPGALLPLILPALGHARPNPGLYQGLFETLMCLCGVGCVLAMASVLRSLGASSRRVALTLGFGALAPLALGSVILSRFDLWPALLVLGALALLLRDRLRLGHGVLALAFATKLFPGVLVPLALAYVWRRRGLREAATCAVVFVAVCAVVVAPFAAVAPHGVWESVLRQTDRPLQIESLGSAILIALHHVAGLHIVWYSSHGSQNIYGHTANTVAAVSTVVDVLALAALWIAFARGPADPERLVRYSAAAVVAFLAFGKVLSPQFMVWLVPLVPLVAGRRGAWASAILAAALVLTQLWFPARYWQLIFPRPGFGPLVSWLVFARDLLLVALLVLLTTPVRAAARSPSPARLRRI